MQNPTIPRVLPFALFIAFIGLEEVYSYLGGASDHSIYVYPLKAVSVTAALIFFRRSYEELKLKDLLSFPSTALSVLAGLAVFVLWINMDWDFATFGTPRGYDPTVIAEGPERNVMTALRLLGASVTVPFMEELFWRSFLIRYIEKPDFRGVAVGSFSWVPFIMTSVLFGLEHNLVLAGVMAGVAYNLLLFKTKSVMQCVLAHSTTNLALGIYVILTGNWRFW